MQEDLNRSRSCRVAIEQKPTSMDQESIKDLSARQKISRCIEKLSRFYQEEIQRPRWIEIVLTSVETRRKRARQIAICQELLRWVKTVFQRREKHIRECNQACYPTKDSNNILSSQKHLLTGKMSSIQIQNTHTHTTSLTNFIFQKQVKTVQWAYINTCIPCDGQITLYLHMYQKQQRICVLCVKTLQDCISIYML